MNISSKSGLPDLPAHLVPDCLTDVGRLPFEIGGLGQFVDYSSWTLRVSCPPKMIPTRGSTKSAGYNLCSPVKIIIPPHGSVLINTSCKITLPSDHYGKIEGLSSLAVKHNIIAFSGVVDEDCEIHVKLFNMGAIPYVIEMGDHIAQMIVQRYANLTIQRVASSLVK